MRVAIFTDNDFDKVNGVTTVLRAVLEHAPSAFGVRIYTASDVARDDERYLAYESWGAPIPYYPEMRLYVPRVFRYLAQARADGVELVHLTTPGPMGLAAMYVAARLGLPMVGSFHTDLAAYTRILTGSTRLGSVMGRYLRWPYGRCARVLVPSQAVRQALERERFCPDRLSVWPRGVDGTQFSPRRRSDELRASWRVSDGRPAIVYVGRVSKEKGLDLLPPLERLLQSLGVPHRFIVVGDGPYREELRRALADAVFTGTLDREGVAAAMASGDLFLFPSTTDTAGNVVLEAQASGVPAIVSAEGGPREYVTDGVTGHVCRGGDLPDFARRVIELLRDRERRRHYADAARAWALANSWPRSLRPLFTAYQDVWDASRAPLEAVALSAVSPDGRS